MIESSSRGDDDEGVMYSQLVRCLSCEQHHILTLQLPQFSNLAFYAFVFFQNLIDLAGSESSKTETTGLRRREGSYINKSLLTLGTVSFHCQLPMTSQDCYYIISSFNLRSSY